MPMAAARCVIPLSFPRKAPAQLISWRTSVKDKFVRDFAVSFIAAIFAGANLSSSAGPSRNMTLRPSAISCSAIARKLCMFQHLWNPPLPG